jgi:hypothetical protein
VIVRKGDRIAWKTGPVAFRIYTVVDGRTVEWGYMGMIKTYTYPTTRRTFWEYASLPDGPYHVDTDERVTGYTNEPVAPLLPLLAEVCK